MANAKKLTEPQIAALRAAAKRGRLVYEDCSAATYRALLDRGLLAKEDWRELGVQAVITPAGRHALFEATGENTAPPVKL